MSPVSLLKDVEQRKNSLKTVNKATKTLNARYYVRLQLMDKPGVVADISRALGQEGISIESLIQRGKPSEGSVPVVLTTHEATAEAMHRVIEKIDDLSAVVEQPCLLQIED